jgi:proteasome lid subunit RPN8/RPN11
MKIFIRPEELRDIEEHGEKAYPNEGVGFLFGRDDGNELVIEAARPVENRRETEAQSNRYEVSPQDFMWAEGEAERLGMDLIGVFHSHPDHPAQPSQFDLDHAMPHFSYLISSIEKGQATVTRAWQLQADREIFDEDTLVVGVARTMGR